VTNVRETVCALNRKLVQRRIQEEDSAVVYAEIVVDKEKQADIKILSIC
jgi:hypothetical protein